MSRVTSSVLLVSYRRPSILAVCLEHLAAQDPAPDEVIVVWQADDVATRDEAEGFRHALPCPLRLVHSPEAGVVAAENAGLDTSTGEVLLLLDDDSIVPPDWTARHLAHYADPTVGAVGGPADNFWQGAYLPDRTAEPVGVIAWYGRVSGNMYDHVPEWRDRPPRDVDHLVGYNLSLRRSAFDRFESALKPYWQMFEMDACLQIKARGYRVVFDFNLVIEHRPNNTAYDGKREGNLAIKVDNAAYNSAFVLAKHTPAPLRPCRLLYLLAVGSSATPGLAAYPFAVRRYRRPLHELTVLGRAMRHHLAGWRDGAKARRLMTRPERFDTPPTASQPAPSSTGSHALVPSPLEGEG
jgi:GT2 family glycosyltransferase